MPKHRGRVAIALASAALISLGSTAVATPSAIADTSGSPLPPEFSDMGPAPAGANDWSCVPSEAHPRPVVLVHGTGSDMATTWQTMAPALAGEGYCVYALDYGAVRTLLDPDKVIWGLGDIPTSAARLATFIDAVLARTGAPKVDIVGHSQGGTVARQYLKFNGGVDDVDPSSSKVENLVTLGGTNHGTNFGGIEQMYLVLAAAGLDQTIISEILFGLTGLGTAGRQQLIGSPTLQRLNAGGEVEPGVRYTVVGTKFDKVVTPPERTFLDPSGSAEVRNMWVQDGCESNVVPHQGLTFDDRVTYIVQSALDPTFSTKNAAPCS
ncbi:alpha/beta fold hydrolase [Rhodococcus sp. PAMC28707]|nr:alpha/beta fold hydrolase [Rhodococcus sp. PAMC28705]QCB57819.1 alpha/beta fold hydrolase [Rhodococcus sp. PAMC28707]